MQNAGSVVTYSQLTSELWDGDDIGQQNNIKVHICHLRQKIEDSPDHPRFIINRIGTGYLMPKLPIDLPSAKQSRINA
jgi:DNA-binding response OmpR family regulator